MDYDPRPIVIDPDTEKTCVCFAGRCNRQAYPEVEQTVIRIRRAGQCAPPLLEYRAKAGEQAGEVCFYWGDKLHQLEAGRYIGDIYEQNQPVGRIQLELHPADWRAEVLRIADDCQQDKQTRC